MTESDFSFQAAELISICQRLHALGFLAAADGNVSFRTGHRIFTTPSGVAKHAIRKQDLAEITLGGAIVKGNPSSEKAMHLAIYRECPQARAVVHAHPPHAIAWTVANPHSGALPEGAMSELILAVGAVPVAPYARPSTAALADNLLPFLPGHRAMILARHGVLCWGETLQEAYNGVERIEHAAKVLCLAQQMGGVSELPETEVSALKAMRKTLGDKIL